MFKDKGYYVTEDDDTDYYKNNPRDKKTEAHSHFLKALVEKIKEQGFGKDKKFLEDKIHMAVFVLALALSLSAFSSYGCNKEAVPTLVAWLEEIFGFKLPQPLIDLIAEFAALGGTASNMVLTFAGTMALRARLKTLLSSLTKGQRHYFFCYLTVMGSAIFAAATNGLVVATEASTPQKAAWDLFINFLAALGPHMLFSIPFVTLMKNSPIGDLLNWLAVMLTLFSTENQPNQADRFIFNASIRLIPKAGYHLSTLSAKDQVTTIQKILAIILRQENSLIQSEEDEIIPINVSSNRHLALSTETREKWEIIQNAFNDRSHSDEYTKYLDDFYSAFSSLPIEERTRFFLVAAKVLEIPYESKAASRFLTLVKAGAVPVFAFACLTNLINLRIFGQEIAERLGAGIFGQTALGMVFFTGGAPAKVAMYVNSGLSMMMRLYFFLQTLLWIWQSNKAVKAFISVTGILAVLIALLSGACYALDAKNLYGEAAFGYLLDFFALFGPEIGNIAQTVFVSIAWGLGAGLVNANAFVEMLTKIVLSFIHCWYPEQKAEDRASELASAVVSTITGNLVPASPSGIAVSEIMHEQYQERQVEIPVENSDRVDAEAPAKKTSSYRLSFFNICPNREDKKTARPSPSQKQNSSLFPAQQDNRDDIVVKEDTSLLRSKKQPGKQSEKDKQFCYIM